MAAAIALAIVLGYAASLWWLLRRETAATLGLLLALCVLAVGLRLAWYSDYPRGLYQDEPLFLQVAIRALRTGRIFREAEAVGVPVLLGSLFEAQLVPFFGAGRWAIRSYSLVTSVLATAAAFAVARACGLRRLPSLAAAAFVAVLPWAVFYGRIHWGGELVFHQLLLLAALARLIWGTGKWAEVAIGSFALCLLVYDYWAGHSMLGMPLVAAALAVGYRRWLCAGVLAVAVAAQIAYLNTTPPPQWNLHSLAARDLSSQPTASLPQRALQTLDTLVRPTAYNYLASIQSAAVHPPLLLGLAVVGLGLALVKVPRHGLFLLAGFLGGLTPALFTTGPPSTHRMLMGFIFVTLAAATALDSITSPRWRTPLIVAAVAVIGVQSVRLYFSPEFWPRDTRKLFDWERTDVLEALPLPPHPPLVVTPQFGEFFLPRALADPNYETLTVENWYPPDGGAIYAFEWRGGPLQAFYETLFGTTHVQSFGRAFLVRFEAADWSWLRAHGWAHVLRCDGVIVTGQVPALFQPGWTFRRQFSLCGTRTTTHTWRGRWNGPTTSLRLYFSGAATIDTGAQVLTDSGFERVLNFVAPADAVITIELVNAPNETMLAEVLDLGGDAPPWPSVSPVEISDCPSFAPPQPDRS